MALNPNWTLLTDGTATLNDGQYRELRGSDHGQMVPGNSTITRKFLVKWTQVGSFLEDLLGYGRLESYVVGGTTYYKVTRAVLPDFHPRYIEFYASEATFDSYDTDTTNFDTVTVNTVTYHPILYQVAIVTATYRVFDFAISSDADCPTIVVNTATIPDETNRWVARQFHPQPEYLTVNGSLYFGQTGDLIKAPPGFVVPKIQKTIIWKDVPAIFPDANYQNPIQFRPPNISSIIACQGTLNSVTFDGDPPGTVLFVGAECKMLTPKISVPAATSPYTWEITLTFLIMNMGFSKYWSIRSDLYAYIGHNFVYDVVNGRWDLVTTKKPPAIGNTMYNYSDLNSIFVIY